MIRSHFGLDQNPFSNDTIALLPQQQEVFDTLRVQCQQGGLCAVLGDLVDELPKPRVSEAPRAG